MESLPELITIKWLLVAILVGISLLTLSVVLVAVVHWIGLGVLKEQLQGKVFRKLSEDMLAKNEIDDLLEYAEERLESHPHDVYAHWYIGQAKYYKGKYPDSKRSFERVVELEPSWYSSAESWFDRLEEKIKEGPKLVE